MNEAGARIRHKPNHRGRADGMGEVGGDTANPEVSHFFESLQDKLDKFMAGVCVSHLVGMEVECCYL